MWKNHGNIKIISDDEEYNSGEDYSQDVAVAQRLPDKYIVELKETRKDQIENVIKSTTVNITATTSIYDFQGKLSFE